MHAHVRARPPGGEGVCVILFVQPFVLLSVTFLVQRNVVVALSQRVTL
uniref:Uncharacterized protein n=1 Tax=Anguilla anguilla TaxID=7936 RepID=A0A0E9QJZ8_ANGAN